MFSFFKKKTNDIQNIDLLHEGEKEKDKDNGAVNSASGLVMTNSARVSTDKAAQTFAKPNKYDRKLYDDGSAKLNAKKAAFKDGNNVYDPYTGNKLEMRIKDAKLKYGENWQEHLAESDHIESIKNVFDGNKDNPWLTNDNIKDVANDPSNIKVTSRKFNNPKRQRTNEEFVNDEQYLKDKGVKLTKQGKQQAIQDSKKAQKSINKSLKKNAVKNIARTGLEAGVNAGAQSGITAATMSGIMNVTAVIKGEKSAEEALADTTVDSLKAGATGFAVGGGLTTISHTLSSSKSEFLKALGESNVPGKVITAVMLTGDTIKRYVNGEISTQECLIDLGDKGLTFATTGYSMAVGQALIPIPIVGAAVGALVGSTLTSKYYYSLINELKTKELEHQERLRIIAECKLATQEMKNFRAELETYLDSYFQDYRHCFDEAISNIQYAFQMGDAEGVVAGANKITRKLGGAVRYDTMDEFEAYLKDDTADIF